MPENNISYRTYTNTEPVYSQYVRQLFPFFRRNAEGKYTDRTMLTIANYSDAFIRYNGDERILNEVTPLIVVAESPFSYDEVSEVKKGGLVGIGLITPNDNRMLIAVHRDMRRNKIGTNVYIRGRNHISKNPILWAGRRNAVGQHFALSLGLVATALNAAGAIRYSDESDEDE